jgi:hypothetical protein
VRRNKRACTSTRSSRASFDLQCPDEQLRFQWFDTKSFGVAGCNRRATYVETCHQGALATMRECTFVRNGAVESTPVESPPPQAPQPTPPSPGSDELESPENGER